MVNLILANGGLWETLINWFQGFIPSFGLTIIVFTILLKIVLSPLEVYQKISAKKNAEKQAILQPKLEKLQKQYGKNKEVLNQKTMELYKKENYNVMGSCFGMLINLVITLVVFITLWSSLNVISQNNIKTEYVNLENEYVAVYKQSLIDSANAQTITITVGEDDTIKSIIDKIEQAGADSTTISEFKTTAQNTARESVSTKYGEIKEGFLWIKNIYRPDTWSSVFPNADEYLSISNTNFKNVSTEVPYTDIFGEEYTTQEESKNAFKVSFDEVTANIKEDYSGWNGWLILVILSAGITVVSQIITTKTSKPKTQYDKKGNEIQPQVPNNKLMMFLLPALMLIFTIQYSAAFALYIVVNSLMSVVISLLTTVVMNSIEKRKANKILVKDTKEV